VDGGGYGKHYSSRVSLVGLLPCQIQAILCSRWMWFALLDFQVDMYYVE